MTGIGHSVFRSGTNNQHAQRSTVFELVFDAPERGREEPGSK
jgi:hypothetical protein